MGEVLNRGQHKIFQFYANSFGNEFYAFQRWGESVSEHWDILDIQYKENLILVLARRN